MELVVRPEQDRFVPAGEFSRLAARLRAVPDQERIAALIIGAFDPRTRMLPFILWDRWIVPASIRSVSAALAEAGLVNQRIVYQNWNPQIRPSTARINGRVPQILLISAMQIHSAAAYELIRDAYQMGADRPLIIAGGPKAIYQPWNFFDFDLKRAPASFRYRAPAAADIVCTGEEFVLLELFDRLHELRRARETMRQAFERARRGGYLDDIPGLMFLREPHTNLTQTVLNDLYRNRTDSHDDLNLNLNLKLEGAIGNLQEALVAGAGGAASERSNGQNPWDGVLVDTGVQRLVQDLDELPVPLEGYRYLEPPHRQSRLAARPLTFAQIHRYSKVASLLTTRGCKFRCGYCPIPAYNQFSFRHKSPERLVHEIAGIRRHLGIHLYFGTDDNFFNNAETVRTTFEALARADFANDDIGKPVRFGTEATEFDVHKHMDMLPLCYRGGLRAIWFGIEDLTAELVKKGQSPDKTIELFAELRRQRILPMAMMMHFEGQPLQSPPGTLTGLLNQIDFLYKHGAASVQVTVLGPAAGTKDYDAVLSSDKILKTLAGKPVEDCYWDGNHVISLGSGKPWQLQDNVLRGYAEFYNPLNVVRAFSRPGWKWSDLFLQLWGMWGLVHTAVRLLPWRAKLRAVETGQYTVHTAVPQSLLPIVPATLTAAEGNGKPTATDQELAKPVAFGVPDSPSKATPTLPGLVHALSSHTHASPIQTALVKLTPVTNNAKPSLKSKTALSKY